MNYYSESESLGKGLWALSHHPLVETCKWHLYLETEGQKSRWTTSFSIVFWGGEERTIICCTNTLYLAFQMTLSDLYLITILQRRYNYLHFFNKKWLSISKVMWRPRFKPSSVVFFCYRYISSSSLGGTITRIFFIEELSNTIEQITFKNNMKQQGPTV